MNARTVSFVAAALAGAALAPISEIAAQSRNARNSTPPVLDSLAVQPPVRQSWTSDKIRLGIGDIVTVLIEERTTAGANLSDNASDTRSKEMSLAIEPPALGGKATPNIDATATFDNNGKSKKSGDVTRTANFSSVMSARVIAVSPTGMMQIRGHKLVNVDRNMQDVVVTGWVRPQDVDAGNNTVLSSRIADAEINYAQAGALGKPKSGILSKLLGLVWP